MSMIPTESELEFLVLDYLQSEGWTLVYGPDIAPGEKAAERSDYRDPVLVGRLRNAVARLNPDIPSETVDEVVKTTLRAESQSVMAENWRAYELLTLGVPVQYRLADGSIRDVRARLVDWDDLRSTSSQSWGRANADLT